MDSSDIEAQLLEGFGDTVDRIVATPIGAVPLLRKGRSGPVKNRYTWMKVYDETRKRYGRPLTLLAAEKIIEHVKPGSHVLIVTNSHEMDGPPGSAALARVLLVGLHAIPVVMANYEPDSKHQRALTQSLTGCQVIPVLSREELTGSIWTPYTAWVYNWPQMSVAEAEEAAEKLLDELTPTAVITVEAVSCNEKGIRHGALGGPGNTGDPEEKFVRWNQLLDAANRRGILTIATGDNGNECGFNTVKDILVKHHEYCRDCGCPCGAGIVSAAGANLVIPATSSNWAAYGVEACLARLLGDPDLMHDEQTHYRMLVNCANEGIPDGATAMPSPSTDGCSHEACMAVITQLRQTLLMSVKEIVRESR
jgi:hypothetical protein